MNKRVLDGFTLAGLVISALAVCDELARWDHGALNLIYLAWGVAAAASVAVVLLFSKPRERLQDICRQVNPPRGFKLFLYGRFLVRIKRLHKGIEYRHDTIEEIYDYWGDIQNPLTAIVWYRLAKILHIYRDEKPYMP